MDEEPVSVALAFKSSSIGTDVCPAKHLSAYRDETFDLYAAKTISGPTRLGRLMFSTPKDSFFPERLKKVLGHVKTC